MVTSPVGSGNLLFLLLILWSLSCSALKDVADLSPEKRLIKTLLADYEERGKMGRPVEHFNDTLLVNYGLSLIQILDLDERNQVLSTNVWATYTWRDIYMQWDPEKYSNITKIRVPSGSIWQPDIKLYNYADERREEKRDALFVVESDGSVLWIPQAIFKSSCAIDIMHFPFDVQICKMKFGSWTYDGSKIDLSFVYTTESGFDMTDYVKSNEWDIKTSYSKKNVIRYACCPEPFVDLTFMLEIRRKPAFYNYILILPCILLSSLTLVLFWLPPESPAKMQLGMNIFVAFFVLLLLLAESTPPAASSIPLIGAYYCLNMVLITLSTFLSVIVVNLYFRGSRTEVPRIVKKVFVDILACLMCMKDQIRENPKLKNQGQVITKDKNCKYDKVGYFEMQTEESWKCLSNGTSGLNNDPESQPQTALQSTINGLESDVREIKIHLRQLYERTVQRELKEKTAKEWRVVALVLDRLFFFVYLTAIVVSIITTMYNIQSGGTNHIRSVHDIN
ncbi:neuronal acetylcholine receptor subunit alpha-5-like isoform X1 [Pecten maximus]|uniref:neuronal acetylcholine receptor subunit alpha-5-like isoform X1 n=1 Tax=Pecten maximus TaxID=6579 RepID=UPI001458E97F|nr:neuronal acetylcholine receptor subunit alpha-5-like isoform X1 [Pecten maximus]XP_033748883.1 neuronal acetylcholine receptor subunit alpha-5-like isoform X1 [Pecten maximus]XP_033748892.1 neuronal acetylcholine receptor subunit alpha-5-like isoform X1 [Pecten maximus]